MKLLYLLPVAIVSLGILIISNPFIEVQAQHDAPFLAAVKAVVGFEHTASQSAVENFYITTVKPELASIITTYSSNVDNFEAIYRPDNEVIYQIGFNDVSGKNIYEFYPKAIFYGDLPNGVTQAQFDTAFNNFMTDLKNEMKTQMVTNGATDIKAHIHYTTGSVDE